MDTSMKTLVKKTVAVMNKHIKTRDEGFSWSTDDFVLKATLGSGQFGKVSLAAEKRTGYLVALKTLSKGRFVKSNFEKQLVREIEIHSRLNHPNILQFFTYFNDDEQIHLVLEFAAGGDVFDKLRAEEKFSEQVSAKYTYQMADALNYCHTNHVIHRDVKPRNLLLTYSGNLKLADFGWSVHALGRKRKTNCGTLWYLAPEILNSRKYDEHVDHWSLGIVCYEFLVGNPPFFPFLNQELRKKIKNLDFVWPEHVTSGAKDLISNLLKKKGNDRISLAGVMSHHWIVENMDKVDVQ